MTARQVLVIAAAVLIGFAAFGASMPHVSLVLLGAALFVASFAFDRRQQ